MDRAAAGKPKSFNEIVGKAITTELDYWKRKRVGLYISKSVERGLFVPDFMLVLEAERVLGHPVSGEQKETVLKLISKLRISSKARWKDFFDV